MNGMEMLFSENRRHHDPTSLPQKKNYGSFPESRKPRFKEIEPMSIAPAKNTGAGPIQSSK